MQTSPTTVQSLARAGLEALHRGDARAARESFERLAAAGQADASVYIALALACRGLRDAPAGLAALEQALAREPRNVRALVMKADHLHAAGDVRNASAFYLAAVKSAPAPLPPDLQPDLVHARQMCERLAAHFDQFLREQLAGQGLLGGERFSQSLDILAGRKRIYSQQPRYYFFPGLPQVQFFDRAQFPWLDAVEAATPAIREELQGVMGAPDAFQPYLRSVPGRPRKEQDGMLDNPAWSAFYLWKDGEAVAENAARCPRTMAALESLPLTKVQNRSPSILFSLLRPGAHIPPHCGLVNTRLIVHLPLIVPPGCSFRVGNETRDWVEGRAWAFDDTFEHEAWNRSGETRVILLFEVWRPELTEQERAQVAALFAAIDAHSGIKPAWEI